MNISADAAAITTFGDGNVVIELDEENKVQSGDKHAGVEKQNSGTLTITDDNETAGSLTANGGTGGAGIGGRIESGASDITISGGTLKVSTNAPEATLSYDRKYLQTLLANSEFGSLALAVGNFLATMENQLAAITAQNGSGSITIGDNSVIMYDLEFSAADSSENNKLDDVMNEIKF